MTGKRFVLGTFRERTFFCVGTIIFGPIKITLEMVGFPTDFSNSEHKILYVVQPWSLLFFF